LQKFKLFWFFVFAFSVGKNPEVLKCVVGLRLAANVWLNLINTRQLLLNK